MALVLITGGARSGKSSAAQALAAELALRGRSVSVAVFARDDGSDHEFAQRVARHRDDRPQGFTTIEAADALSWTEAVPSEDVLLLDCLGTLLGTAMEDAWASATSDSGRDFAEADASMLPAGYETAVEKRFEPALEWLLSRDGDTIVVTNEVGDGVVPAFASARLFRDTLGRANRALVARSDAAYLCVCGRLLDLNASPGVARWPED